MSHVTATASGGANNFGVLNSSSSSPTMSHVTATASGNGVGMRFFGGGAAQVDSSTLTGTIGVNGTTAGTRITNTRIVGGVLNDIGGTQCRNTYDEALVDVSC